MVANPHERIASEVESRPELIEKLRGMCDSRSLPDAYFANPIVQAQSQHGLPVFPLSLYFDGICIDHRRESVLNFTIQNLVSGKRHLLMVLPKRQQCRCGCRGWCSVFGIYKWLKWSLTCLINGEMPEHRHDLQPWSKNDRLQRSGFAKQQFGFRAFVYHLRGDWSEFAHSMGFVPWNAVRDPCFLCNTSADLMQQQLQDCNAVDCPYDPRTNATFDSDCTA
eukprot:7575174-Alexandrium_andersonii.AAC.1